MTRVSVVFDFDGTIALGDGPLIAYARSVGEVTRPEIGRDCIDAVHLFNRGQSSALDAYAAVRDAAIAHHVDDATLSRAYLRSRELLATDAAPIHPPAGLAAFLADLADTADSVVATNAPDTGLPAALASLGVTDLVTEVHASVGKPAGLRPIITRLLQSGPVLAVGDIWHNDLEPAAELGAGTAQVGVAPRNDRATLYGATLTDLYDDIRTWVTAAHADAAVAATISAP